MRKWNYRFEVPDIKKCRMIVYTDCKNEADDQFALAHHLMTQKFMVKGIIGAHFNGNAGVCGAGKTAQASVDEIHKVLRLMDVDDMYEVYRGTEYPLEDLSTPRKSEAAEFIIREAMRDDPHPLFIACQGSLTDLASAILMEPQICSRMTAIWIGGGMYPEGGFEFNCKMDPLAANVLMSSLMPVWQIPIMVYKQMAVSLSELQLNVQPCGAIGDYLFSQMVELNMKAAAYAERIAEETGDFEKGFSTWPQGETWGLGDSPTVGVLLEESEKTDIYEMRPAPSIDPETLKYSFETQNREIRVYREVNARLILNDFFAKLKLNYGGAGN